MRRVAAVVVLSLAVGAACDQRAPTDPARTPAPNAAMLDGSSGGNPHFFFLPPLVAEPGATGVANLKLAPTVEICTNTSQDALGHCTTLLAAFNRFGGSKNADQIEIDGQHYVLNWKTTRYAIAENAPFRVVVLVGDIQLGYIDLIKQGSSFRNFTTGAVIGRGNNGTLPLKFRIESGALCTLSSTECFEGAVGPAGGTFTIDRTDGTKPAGTEFPSGALEETVTLIIERVPSGECLPTDVPQYQGCYRFHTEPHVDNFELPVTVGVCLLDAAGVPFFNDGQLRLWKWSEVVGDAIQELERVQINYLECPSLSTLGARTGHPLMLGAARAGSWLVKPLVTLFGPRDAYALAPYEGGKLSNFSRIGWVRPLNVEIRDGDGQTGVAGAPLPTAAKVRVTNKYGFTLQGVPGRVVDFTASGNGSATPSTGVTDAAGEASTIWTLSSTAGANTLLARTPTSRAIAPTPYEAEAVFNATGTPPYSAMWLPTLAPTYDELRPWLTGLQPSVVISVVNGAVLTTLPVIPESGFYYASWVLPALDPNVVYRIAVQLAGNTIGYVDVVYQAGKLRLAGSGALVLDTALSSALPIKFRVVQ